MQTKFNKKKNDKKVIGRRDIIDLPKFGLMNVPCKIDTGAYTSAIHCHNIHIVEHDDGSQELSFSLLDPTHKSYKDTEYRTKNFKQKAIKSSFGRVVYRYIITTNIIILGEKYKTEFSLADREEMRYPILLGRKLLRHNFVVDVAKTDLSYKKKLKNSKT